MEQVLHAVAYQNWSLNAVLYEYSQTIIEYCIIFSCKYVPMAFYMYRFIKDIYLTSRENIRQRRKEMEDIQGQIQIVNAKLCYRDAEFTEGAERLRLSAEKLRNVRERVRAVISNDEKLTQALQTVTHWESDIIAANEQDSAFISELLEALKYKNFKANEKTDIEQSERAHIGDTPESSLYSSLSEVEVRKDYRLKIVRITNVYKVAYFKHYIKQKRLRRANRDAILKKKMENIKNLLENWQKALTTVINSKLTMLNIDSHTMGLAPQEAMGDYTKPESYDSDSEPRNRWYESCYNDYNQSWLQNQYNSYCQYNYKGDPDAEELTEFSESPGHHNHARSANMMSILEETNSQIANDGENKSEKDDDLYYEGFESSDFHEDDNSG